MLRIGVAGAGSIGCYLGGKLALAGAEVTLLGRSRVAVELAEHGLHVCDFGLEPSRVVGYRYTQDERDLATCDVVLVSVKSALTDIVGAELAKHLEAKALVVSMQNGLDNADTLRRHLPCHQVLGGIVEFNVVSRGAGLFHRTTDGRLIVEATNAAAWKPMADTLRRAGLNLKETRHIVSEQWAKLLINANNAVSALTGAPTRDLVRRAEFRQCIAVIMEEGLKVARASGIAPARLRGIPARWMPRILRLPNSLVRLITRAQIKIDPDARSSMWEDLSRRAKTEVDFLNGAIVARAESAGMDAPINRRVVELVHEAEAARKGSPEMGGDELYAALVR